METYKVDIPSFEKNIPYDLDSAMIELDRRMMITGQMNMGKVNARMVVRELLEDLIKGLESKSKQYPSIITL
jgi:hypothetical protein